MLMENRNSEKRHKLHGKYIYFSGWFHWFLACKYLPVDSCKQSVAVCQQFIVPFWQGNNSSFQTTWNLEDKSLGFL